MKGDKKPQKVKEPVRVRQRKLANGNMSLYLDAYVKGARKVESLGLYIVPERTATDRRLNIEARQIAERIKAERIMALREHGVRQWNKVRKSCVTLLDFLKEYETERTGPTASTVRGRRDMRKKVEAYLKENGMTEIVMANVDVDFCKDFIEYLRHARNGRKKEYSTITNGTAHSLQTQFNGALNKAVRDGILTRNPMQVISPKEKIRKGDSIRAYLTLEELRDAMDAYCPHNDVKKAFLFSCFCGLRLGDVRSLTWSRIQKSPDGKTLLVSTLMQKTKRQINLPLSNEAIECLNKREDPDERIFSLPSPSVIESNIAVWMEDAGIRKHITFHCARHTFATMMLTLGADIYTTSKLLGHTKVDTTAIYAKIVDQKKVEAISLVDGFFSKQRQTEEEE